jgi:hypothetical protein
MGVRLVACVVLVVFTEGKCEVFALSYLSQSGA